MIRPRDCESGNYFFLIPYPYDLSLVTLQRVTRFLLTAYPLWLLLYRIIHYFLQNFKHFFYIHAARRLQEQLVAAL